MNRNCSKRREKWREERESHPTTTSNMHGSHEAAGYQEPLSLEIVPRDKRGVPHQTYANATGELNRWTDDDATDLENGRIRVSETEREGREVFYALSRVEGHADENEENSLK